MQSPNGDVGRWQVDGVEEGSHAHVGKARLALLQEATGEAYVRSAVRCGAAHYVAAP